MQLSRHLCKISELKNSINADVSRGFPIAKTAEKHGWPESLVCCSGCRVKMGSATLIDADLIDDPAYATSKPTALERVKWLLGKLNSDDRHGTDYFANKFVSKIEVIFDGLPKPVKWQSFYRNDLPVAVGGLGS